MVIVMKQNTPVDELEQLKARLRQMGFDIHLSQGENHTVIGLIGDSTRIDESQLQANPFVDRILRVQHPFKRASRMFHPEDTVIDLDGLKLGGGNTLIIAGPCSVESEEQLMTIAQQVKAAGAHLLRGGAFKPRTSPYSFQGLGLEGLELLRRAKELTGMPIVTECISVDTVDLVAEYADVVQIGARNMQNFALLKKVGQIDRAVLLKRGMSATIEEFLMAAEYILAEGNERVILCERGIRTYETYTRNTLDISAIVAIKELSHLPIICDPSHAAGKWEMVTPLAKAAIAAGADGLMVEVHHRPEIALSDGSQSLKPERFHRLVAAVNQIIGLNKSMVH
ncbi:MAG: 3-deoxy-7-phosphoheptulonate synthase [Limnochordia bacterium]|jgi:3-deoxy-7-phosphoheptulonate synthase|nr:3-deoxy-7-phosphoheptulonate synthase [Bacillota bacterium]HOB08045.1 3-deoxy-7-phosphoheptulonate synthase [Limnochordia bacterium]NLH32240.1 3-deoxy-7-phosphoheptulonate synthase [Bacillota bacterium]HPT92482.1 3-deoxy-7-phosphoheptulonate synthase [Limnochordia bacterium]HPZ30260.1 3-deoxy-7-phosphoheptulonate synthase [Limnochordia bacterium]